MLCNHDTDFFTETIVTAKGRRYNVLPPDSGLEPLISRNITRDDVAGFFHALILNEQHMEIVRFVNLHRVVDHEMVIEHMEMKFKNFKKVIDECIMHGLVYENNIITEFGDSKKEYYWYSIDSGGVFTLEQMREKYMVLPFTATLDEKYKLYRKSQFLFDNRDILMFKNHNHCETKNRKTYEIELIENVSTKKNKEYKNTIFLVNMETLRLLNINEEVKAIALQFNNNGNNYYDISSKCFIEFQTDQ